MKANCFKKMISSFIIFFFITISSFADKPAEFEIEYSEKALKVKTLFSDISTVNLLNGLHLTTDQMKGILKLAKKAQNIKQEFLGENASIYMNALEEAEITYTKLFNEIMKGDPARGDIEKKAAAINHRLKVMKDKAARNIENELSVIHNELSKILTNEQQQVIDTFKPCLIPPKDLKNPVRAGQASSSDRGVKILRRLRDIPDYAWNHRKNEIISRMVERFSRYRSVLTEEEKEKEIKRLLDLTNKVRSMSDTDFELEKENLAEMIKPVDRIDELREELHRREPYMRKPKASKAVRFLLNKRIIPILEQRIYRAT
jgi:hypothetical protein